MLEKCNCVMVSESTAVSIRQLLEDYYTGILEAYEQEHISPEAYADILLAISCGYDFFENKERWTQIGYDLCRGIKQKVEHFPPEPEQLGMLSEFGNDCFCVNLFSQKTGCLQSFAASLNLLLLESAAAFVQTVQYTPGTNMKHYDLVFGIAGIANYLLEFDLPQGAGQAREGLLAYLIDLTKNYQYNGREIIRYHIPVNQQAREEERADFPDGHINFGLAHGMAGPLLALSKANGKKILADGGRGAVDKLFHIYDAFQVFQDNVIRWPTQLSVDDYLIQQYNDIYRGNFAGWCYGNLGVAAALRKAAQHMEDMQRALFYERELEKVVNRPVERYNLNNIAVCHGHAGALYIRTNLFYQTGNSIFITGLQEQIDAIFQAMEPYKQTDNSYDLNSMEEVLFQGSKFFLSGLSGIVIALLSVIGKNDALGLLLGII